MNQQINLSFFLLGKESNVWLFWWFLERLLRVARESYQFLRITCCDWMEPLP